MADPGLYGSDPGRDHRPAGELGGSAFRGDPHGPGVSGRRSVCILHYPPGGHGGHGGDHQPAVFPEKSQGSYGSSGISGGKLLCDDGRFSSSVAVVRGSGAGRAGNQLLYHCGAYGAQLVCLQKRAGGGDQHVRLRPGGSLLQPGLFLAHRESGLAFGFGDHRNSGFRHGVFGVSHSGGRAGESRSSPLWQGDGADSGQKGKGRFCRRKGKCAGVGILGGCHGPVYPEHLHPV